LTGRIVREHNPQRTRDPVEWPVSFHRHDPAHTNEVGLNCCAQIEDALLNAFQRRIFFGRPYFAPVTMPNMFFMLSVTPDQAWVLMFGMETNKSAFSKVRRSQRSFNPYILREVVCQSAAFRFTMESPVMESPVRVL